MNSVLHFRARTDSANLLLDIYDINRMMSVVHQLRAWRTDWMPRRKSSHVTDAELEILRILWDHGPTTVRDVHESLTRGQDVRYTTILKTMQNMFEKGLLARDESERSHVYTARLKQKDTERKLVRQFMDKVFDGATEQLVLQALNAKSISTEDVASIRKMLDEWEQQHK